MLPIDCENLSRGSRGDADNSFQLETLMFFYNPTPSDLIFQQANYNDRDGGVLFGRWTEKYPKNCTPPTAWTGSVAILEKFWNKKYYVKYGQCWVFSGLVTTCK